MLIRKPLDDDEDNPLKVFILLMLALVVFILMFLGVLYVVNKINQ